MLFLKVLSNYSVTFKANKNPKAACEINNSIEPLRLRREAAVMVRSGETQVATKRPPYLGILLRVGKQ